MNSKYAIRAQSNHGKFVHRRVLASKPQRNYPPFLAANVLILDLAGFVSSAFGKSDSISVRFISSTSARNRQSASETISLGLSLSSPRCWRRASINDKTNLSAGVSRMVIGRALSGSLFFRAMAYPAKIHLLIKYNNVIMRLLEKRVVLPDNGLTDAQRPHNSFRRLERTNVLTLRHLRRNSFTIHGRAHRTFFIPKANLDSVGKVGPHS